MYIPITVIISALSAFATFAPKTERGSNPPAAKTTTNAGRSTVLDIRRLIEFRSGILFALVLNSSLLNPHIFLHGGKALRTAVSASSPHLTLHVHQPTSHYPNTITEAAAAVRREQQFWWWTQWGQVFGESFRHAASATYNQRMVFQETHDKWQS